MLSDKRFPHGFRVLNGFFRTGPKVLGADGDMTDLIVKYSCKNFRTVLVTRFPYPAKGSRGHVETAGLQNHRHDGEPCSDIVPGIMGGLP